jgi:hypothetical protein
LLGTPSLLPTLAKKRDLAVPFSNIEPQTEDRLFDKLDRLLSESDSIPLLRLPRL